MPKKSSSPKTNTKSKISKSKTPLTPFKLYGRNSCPFTQRAKMLLESKKFPFDYLDISASQQEFFSICRPKIGNHQTVPVVFHDGKFIGGFQELEQYLQNKRL
jgi:glutaredoxin